MWSEWLTLLADPASGWCRRFVGEGPQPTAGAGHKACASRISASPNVGGTPGRAGAHGAVTGAVEGMRVFPVPSSTMGDAEIASFTPRILVPQYCLSQLTFQRTLLCDFSKPLSPWPLDPVL